MGKQHQIYRDSGLKQYTLEHGTGSIHQEITNFYNSLQPELTGTITLTVRGWLSTQSFAEQQDFGIRVIIAFGGTV
ncbi:MAG: hypothetical protein JGK23_31395 [Microcoleus sp. PH2017_19_SFW_U_A]|nr:hypothetical protein [Microcoleus sp. PH2017_19_SFW_U_A]